MRSKGKKYKIGTIIIFIIMLVSSNGFAGPIIESVSPSIAEIGQNLEVTITGTSFNKNTRVSIALDSGWPVTGSADMPGDALNVAIAGDKVYIADGRKGLQIADVSNPANPYIISLKQTAGYARGVDVVGNTAYVVCGRCTKEGCNWSGLQVIDVSDSANPVIKGAVDTADDSAGVAVADGKAYVIAGNNGGLQIIDVSSQINPFIISSADIPGTPTGIAVTGTTAYVSTNKSGLQIIDANDPANPVIIGAAEPPPSPMGSPDGDWASGIAISGTTAYVTYIESGLQIIDVHNPASPVVLATVDADFAVGLAVKGNIACVIDEGKGLMITDVSKLTNPRVIGYADAAPWIKAVKLSENAAYIISSPQDSRKANNKLQLVDIREKSGVVSVNVPEHANDVAVAGSTACVAWGDHENNTGGLQFIDIKDQANPMITGTADVPGCAGKVTISGNSAYVVWNNIENNTSGLQITDISDPVITGLADMAGYINDFAVSGNTAFIVMMNLNNNSGGLRIIDVADPAKPGIIGSVDISGAIGVAVSGTTVYVTWGNWFKDNGGLKIIDAANPASPEIVGSVDTPKRVYGITAADSVAYLAGDNGVNIIDVSNPAKPIFVGSVDTGCVHETTVSGSTVYAAGYELHVIDVANFKKPVIVGSVDIPFFAGGISVIGNTAYVANNNLDIIPVPVSIKSVTVHPKGISFAVPKQSAAGFYRLRVFNGKESYELAEPITFYDKPGTDRKADFADAGISSEVRAGINFNSLVRAD
ncbi:MAG: hypothetical protein GY795_44540 [Desulfobacterales bacterium]|nr:hypothetical protein [Desulfobacterales bacterium]